MWPFSKKREQKARQIAASAHTCENPPRAHSVREEYLHIATRLCKCGNRLESFDHALRYHNGRPRDVILARCTRCRALHCFVYDISFFLGKPPEAVDKGGPSEILDVMDWAHHGYTCLHQSMQATGDRLDQRLEDAIWSFEEMLKFYPVNGSYPFPTAFFNHRAVSSAHLRTRYPRHLATEPMTAARARFGKCDRG